MLKSYIILLLIVTALYMAFEAGEQYYWTATAGCPCDSCIEAYQDQQRRINTLSKGE